MRKYITILILLGTLSVCCQKRSNLLMGVNFQKIPFKFINNLIIIPLELNGVKGDFILDTGVRGNILFLGDHRDFQLKDSLKTVNLKGFGYGEPIKAYISVGNDIHYKKMFLARKNFFLLQDEKFNFSAKTGIPIHGLIGSDFFRNNVIKIDYKRKRITVYDPTYYYRNTHKVKKIETVVLVFHNLKPYLQAKVKILETDTLPISVKLLIDTGSTESLWLFKDTAKFKQLPTKYFTDFLGESLTGSIYGDKSRIHEFSFGVFDLENPVVSFLDEDVAVNAKKIKGRNGTLGAGILKRFTVWFDYRNARMYLKKNSNFKKEFYYNMSGLEVSYNGNVMVLESRNRDVNLNKENEFPSLGYHIVSKPSYIIANVRKGSIGDLVGIMQGDVILEIDSRPVYKNSFGYIIDRFYKKKNKQVDLLIGRDGKQLHFNFKLVDELN